MHTTQQKQRRCLAPKTQRESGILVYGAYTTMPRMNNIEQTKSYKTQKRRANTALKRRIFFYSYSMIMYSVCSWHFSAISHLLSFSHQASVFAHSSSLFLQWIHNTCLNCVLCSSIFRLHLILSNTQR